LLNHNHKKLNISSNSDHLSGEIALDDEASQKEKELEKKMCPNCNSRLKWEYRAWDLDRQQHLVLFGYYVCSECHWRSSLKTRKFKFPEQQVPFRKGTIGLLG
jgi:uncharacterized protein YlaI